MIQDPERAYALLGWRLQSAGEFIRLNSIFTRRLGMAAIRSFDDCGHGSTPDEENVRIVLMQSGTVDGDYGGNSITLGPGTLTLMRGAVPAQGAVVSPSSRFAMQVPARLFDGRRFGTPWGQPTPIGEEQAESFLALCRSFMRGRGRDVDADAVDDFANATVLYLRSMLTAHQGAHPAAATVQKDITLRAMHEVIELNFRNPDFSVSQLADALFMSESTLRRICASVYTTPLAEIRRRRVKEASSLLQGESRLPASVGAQIARSVGFSSRIIMYRAIAKERSRMENASSSAG